MSAFVLGGTGANGKAIVKALLEHPNFQKVTLIGRRKLELPSLTEHPNFWKIDQKIIDFDNVSEFSDVFQGFDVGFCTLGISSVGLSNEDYFRITYDYCVSTAKLAKDGGCKHFHFLSGGGASKISPLYWARTKALVEEELSRMKFERLSIYQPAGVVKEKEYVSTKIELAEICFFKFIDPFRLVSIDSLRLGELIVNNTFEVQKSKVEILGHCEIQKWIIKIFNIIMGGGKGKPTFGKMGWVFGLFVFYWIYGFSGFSLVFGFLGIWVVGLFVIDAIDLFLIYD